MRRDGMFLTILSTGIYITLRDPLCITPVICAMT